MHSGGRLPDRMMACRQSNVRNELNEARMREKKRSMSRHRHFLRKKKAVVHRFGAENGESDESRPTALADNERERYFEI